MQYGICMVLGKREIEEEIIRIENLDRATCEYLKGAMDETGACLVRIKSNPNDPDTLLIEAIKYKGRGSIRQE